MHTQEKKDPQAIARWTFDRTLTAEKTCVPFTLRTAQAEPEWVQDGVWGEHGIRIRPGAHCYLPRSELGALNIFGPGAHVTVAAWVKRKSPSPWQFIAGVWDESRSKRQYGLFLNAARYTDQTNMQRQLCTDRLHGHISDVGSATPGDRCWLSYATGASSVPMEEWQWLAMTYDGQAIRVYLNGTLDHWAPANPFYFNGGIFDGGEEGAEFTVGANFVGGKMINCFDGILGGLVVFNQALSGDQLTACAKAGHRTPPT